MPSSILTALVVAGITASQAAYNPQLGVSYAWLSSASYCPAAAVKSWSCQACKRSGVRLQNVKWLQNDKTENFGYIGHDDKGKAYIAYRGSNNLNNWMHDFSFGLVSYPGCNGCKVHSGFYQCYLALSAQLDDALHALDPNEIIATGHSLGAAMTHLTAFDLALAGKPLTTMYNYGQPRVGNPTYSNSYASYVTRGLHDSVAFNDALLADHVANNTLIAISPILVRAIERALFHPVNDMLTATDTTKKTIIDVLWRHSRIAVALAQNQSLETGLQPGLLRGAEGSMKLADEHIQALKSLQFIRPQNNRLRADRNDGELSAFRIAQSYRITHHADPVPRLPPEAFGFHHSTQEIWYNADSSQFTSCSASTGEDPKCSLSIMPLGIADHVTYYNMAINGLC